MVQAAFGGLADVLLRGVDYAQQQRQRQMQQAALMQQLLGTTPPPTVDVPTPHGTISMTADQLIKAGMFQPETPETPALPGGFFADLHEATRTGDWSRFRQQWGDVSLPTADVARIFQAPQYAATAGLRGVEADERRGALELMDEVLTPEDAEYIGRPELAGRTWRQALMATGVAGDIAGVEETRSRTGLNWTKALVEEGQLELARDQFGWKQFVDEQELSQREREFLASQEGEEWKRGFEERKQQFFEEVERRRLSGEEAAREFDEWERRERLELDRAAHTLRSEVDLGELDVRRRLATVEEQRLAHEKYEAGHRRLQDALEHQLAVHDQEFRHRMAMKEHELKRDEFRWSQLIDEAMLDIYESEEQRARVSDEFDQRMRERELQLREEVERGKLSIEEAKLALEEESQAILLEIAQAEDARAAERHAADMEAQLLENEMLRIRTEYLPEQLQTEIRRSIASATRDEAEARAVTETLSYVIEDLQASTALDVARAAQIDAETATEEELRQVRYDLMMAEAEQALAAAGLSDARANEILNLIEPTLAKIEAETALAEAQTESERARGAEAWQRVDDIGMDALWQILGLPGEPPADIPVHRWQLDSMARALMDSRVSPTAAPEREGIRFADLAAVAGIDTSAWPQDVANAVVPVGSDPRALGEALQNLSAGFMGGDTPGVRGPQVPEGSGAVQSLSLQYARAMSDDPQEQVKLADQWVQRLQSAYNAYLRYDQQQNMLFGGIRDRDAPPVLSLEEFAMHYYTGDPLPMGGPLQRLDATQQAWLYDALEQYGHPTAFKRYLEGLNARQRRQILERFGMPATGWNDLMDIVSWIEQQALSEGMVMP